MLDMRFMSGKVIHYTGSSTASKWGTGSYVTFSRKQRWAARTHRGA